MALGADRTAGNTGAAVGGLWVLAAVTVKVGMPALVLRSVAELRRKTSVPMANGGAAAPAVVAFEAGDFEVILARRLKLIPVVVCSVCAFWSRYLCDQ